MMLDFIKQYWIDIIIVLAFIVAMFVLYKRGHKDIVKKIILSLVVEAEKNLGSGTGEFKFAYVVEKIYAKLPVILRIMFTEKDISNMIEEAVSKLKEMLQSGEVNLLDYETEAICKLDDNNDDLK